MATKNFQYLTYLEAVKFHLLFMRKIGETRIGVFDKNLVESALNRPRHAFDFDDADIYQQAATLLFGLIKKSSVARRKQTHRNFLNKYIFEAKWI